MNDEKRYFLKLVVSMIPVGIVGVLLRDHIDAMLSSQYIMAVVGAMLLLTAALLAFAYYARPRQRTTISYRDAFIIGLGQAVATMPGLSRSGTTIATGLLLGNDKSAVATFSFLMVLAPILGQTLLDVMDGGMAVTGIGVEALIAGFISAFVVGCLACRFMIDIVKRGKLIWFAIYCAVVGVVAIGTYIF
jgi:undecaprenyl-diphosphatase